MNGSRISPPILTMSAFDGGNEVDSSDDHQHHQRAAASLWSIAFDVEAAVGNSSPSTISEHHATDDFVLLSAVAASEASECGDFDGFLSGVDSMIDAVDTRMFPYPGTMRDVSWWEAVVKVTFYVILFVVSLVGNVFVVWTVYRNRTMRSPTTYYLVNLAICDLMVTLLCVWVHLVVDLTEGWVFGAFFCKFSSFAQDGSLKMISNSELLMNTIGTSKKAKPLLMNSRGQLMLSMTKVKICALGVPDVMVFDDAALKDTAITTVNIVEQSTSLDVPSSAFATAMVKKVKQSNSLDVTSISSSTSVPSSAFATAMVKKVKQSTSLDVSHTGSSSSVPSSAFATAMVKKVKQFNSLDATSISSSTSVPSSASATAMVKKVKQSTSLDVSHTGSSSSVPSSAFATAMVKKVKQFNSLDVTSISSSTSVPSSASATAMVKKVKQSTSLDVSHTGSSSSVPSSAFATAMVKKVKQFNSLDATSISSSTSVPSSASATAMVKKVKQSTSLDVSHTGSSSSVPSSAFATAMVKKVKQFNSLDATSISSSTSVPSSASATAMVKKVKQSTSLDVSHTGSSSSVPSSAFATAMVKKVKQFNSLDVTSISSSTSVPSSASATAMVKKVKQSTSLDVSHTGSSSSVPSSAFATAIKKVKQSNSLDVRCTDSSLSQSVVTLGKTSKKPSRPCPFCGVMQTQLSRHLQLKHKLASPVKAAMSKKKNERDIDMSRLKKLGILKANKSVLQKNSMDLMTERRMKNAGNCQMCTSCEGFYAPSHFRRHITTCRRQLNASGTNNQCDPSALPVQALVASNPREQNFIKEVIVKFRKDETGQFCVENKFGQYEYRQSYRKKAKKVEVRHSVMRDMRRLVTLFFAFRRAAACDKVTVTIEQLLSRGMFPYLETAVDEVSIKEDKTTKHGLLLGLGYLLKRVAKFAKGDYLQLEDDASAKNVAKFVTLLDMNWTTLFGSSEYEGVMTRQDRLRKPAQLPVEEDVKKLRNYTVDSIKQLTEDPYKFVCSKSFKRLRDLVVVRLTMFNARRGGEPCRMLVKEWLDAQSDAWFDETAVQKVADPAEKCLFGKYKLAYQAGKGSHHLVPVLIPVDCVAAIEILADYNTRISVGVRSDNNFLFPYMHGSEDHVSGWHAVHQACIAAGVNKSLNATSMRHRASTVYASLEVPEADRLVFYDHMGHSELINKNVYQCPRSIATMTKVGKYFNTLDMQSENEPGTAQLTAHEISSIIQSGTDQTGTEDVEPDSDSDEPIKVKKQLVFRSLTIKGNKKGRKRSPSPTATDDDDEDSDSKNSDLSAIEKIVDTTQKTAKRTYNQWNDKDTKTVQDYFHQFLYAEGQGTTGALPSSSEVLAFMATHTSVMASEKDGKKRAKLIRSKVFNDRRLLRFKVIRQLKKMSQNS